MTALKLPLNEDGERRAAAHAEWRSTEDAPLDLHDIIEG